MGLKKLIPVIALMILSSCLPVTAKMVSDQLERKIEVPDDPQRIVSLAPSITEMEKLLKCGCGFRSVSG